ncbi:Serine/threonine-protein kinase DCLK3 [Cladobotryum mycophilum]|uniref:Serine/threonine-protein kinase DCLK3 n=1 Tax=Cladobotryum mycophilum TaxID=491253 RepID=A0ABR0T2S4_9HYPO
MTHPRHIPGRPEDCDEDSNIPSIHRHLSCLEIRFGDLPRTSHGILFGRGQDNDVVLPYIPGISSDHFSLTFDKSGRFIVKDRGSLMGTEVLYDGQGHGPRSDFQWIVGGHHVPQNKKDITIKVHSIMAFRIIVEQHDITSQAYINKVESFCRGATSVKDQLTATDPAGRPTPSRAKRAAMADTGEIHLKKVLDQGSYGIVSYCWNVSDGNEYALKEPTATAIRKEVVEPEDWKEARLMAQISHPNIVKFFKADFEPHPRLFLEYVPDGSLWDHQEFTAHERLSILSQCLSALTYMHEQSPPIAHRDIKPSNILVQHRLPGDIHVKLADFGSSREGYDLSTVCGSRLYVAPEVYTRSRIDNSGEEKTKYTSSVDIWSLGLVVYQLMCHLPKYKSSSFARWGPIWCEDVVKALHRDLERRPSPLKRFLLNNMIVFSPELRLPTSDCYLEALILHVEQAGTSYILDDEEEEDAIKSSEPTTEEGTSGSFYEFDLFNLESPEIKEDGTLVKQVFCEHMANASGISPPLHVRELSPARSESSHLLGNNQQPQARGHDTISISTASASASSVGIDVMATGLTSFISNLEFTFNNGDVDQIMRLFADDAKYHNYLVGLTDISKHDIHDFYDDFLLSHQNVRFTTRCASGTPDFLAWEIDISFTAGQDIDELEVREGDAVLLRGVSLISWRNDKIVELKEYLSVVKDKSW